MPKMDQRFSTKPEIDDDQNGIYLFRLVRKQLHWIHPWRQSPDLDDPRPILQLTSHQAMEVQSPSGYGARS
jgi:hypothetical protein